MKTTLRDYARNLTEQKEGASKMSEREARATLAHLTEPGDSTIGAWLREMSAADLIDMIEHGNVPARALRAKIHQDWRDDQENVRGADHVEVAWIARDSRGRVIFQSDMVLSAAQAVGMFQGIGEASL